MKSKKINIVIGGTFHLPMLYTKLANLGHDLKIYTSTPKFKFKNNELKKNIVFIPMFFQIIKKLSGYNLRPWMKNFDNFIFDKITSLIMRRADILYGFAGCSLISGSKIKRNGGKYFLDRACPHIEYQNNILMKESKKCDVRFFPANSKTLKRCILEYFAADKIITPSSYTQNTFLNRAIVFISCFILLIFIELMLKYTGSNFFLRSFYIFMPAFIISIIYPSIIYKFSK